HGFISFEVNYHAVERARVLHGASFREQKGISLTYLPFVLWALAEAVKDFPLVNAAVDGDRLLVRRDLNVGIAVDLSYKGLVVPVLRDVPGLRLARLAQAVSELAGRARAGKLGKDDLSDATFTVTNPGASGTYLSIPIINQPQVAILVTDGIRKSVDVVERDGLDMIVVRPKGFIGLSMDHRAFDGAYAADFLKTLKGHLEEKDWLAEI
ncbi:MAG: 2-oxo acid dehydrogenase subunit E2, partial [Phycisphaerales bacterium]|nr:2-oxo acid dehydrogenase subunit E2 [Phycisphaerales bacterium]